LAHGFGPLHPLSDELLLPHTNFPPQPSIYFGRMILEFPPHRTGFYFSPLPSPDFSFSAALLLFREAHPLQRKDSDMRLPLTLREPFYFPSHSPSNLGPMAFDGVILVFFPHVFFVFIRCCLDPLFLIPSPVSPTNFIPLQVWGGAFFFLLWLDIRSSLLCSGINLSFSVFFR